jgi:hypothetical protein
MARVCLNEHDGVKPLTQLAAQLLVKKILFWFSQGQSVCLTLLSIPASRDHQHTPNNKTIVRRLFNVHTRHLVIFPYRKRAPPIDDGGIFFLSLSWHRPTVA